MVPLGGEAGGDVSQPACLPACARNSCSSKCDQALRWRLVRPSGLRRARLQARSASQPSLPSANSSRGPSGSAPRLAAADSGRRLPPPAALPELTEQTWAARRAADLLGRRAKRLARQTKPLPRDRGTEARVPGGDGGPALLSAHGEDRAPSPAPSGRLVPTPWRSEGGCEGAGAGRLRPPEGLLQGRLHPRLPAPSASAAVPRAPFSSQAGAHQKATKPRQLLGSPSPAGSAGLGWAAAPPLLRCALCFPAPRRSLLLAVQRSLYHCQPASPGSSPAGHPWRGRERGSSSPPPRFRPHGGEGCAPVRRVAARRPCEPCGPGSTLEGSLPG